MNYLKWCAEQQNVMHSNQEIWEAARKDLVEVAEAVKELNFGASVALPWCRESFPRLDTAMKKYEDDSK